MQFHKHNIIGLQDIYGDCTISENNYENITHHFSDNTQQTIYSLCFAEFSTACYLVTEPYS